MAQLKDTTIDGVLEVSNKIILPHGKDYSGIHPDTGDIHSLLSISENGNTVVGYSGYSNGNGNTHIYGDDIIHYVKAAGSTSYKPYRSAGDSTSITFRGSGYVTNSGKDVTFLVPFSMPIIGNPTVTVSSLNGFVLRQGAKYTHGSAASVYATPNSYQAFLLWQIGIVITAKFATTTNVTNNDAIGIYWNGTISFS